MKLLNIVLSSVLAMITTAATLAPNLPDGVYHAFTDENGMEHHTRLTQDGLAPLSWTYDSRVP